jgi:hypothetical protein
MRTLFAAALALAAALAAPCVSAQAITFPSPAFRGGNTDWQIKLTTQSTTLVYELKVPESAVRLNGPLKHVKAPQPGQYQLLGVIGVEKSALTVKIAPVKLGEKCQDNKGDIGGAYGPYTYAIVVAPTQFKPATGAKHKPWPKLWYGCGNFTLD